MAMQLVAVVETITSNLMGCNFKWFKVMGVLLAIGLHIPSAGATGCCTDGFHSLQQLISATDTISAPDRPLLGLHPAFRITCDGNLTEIIYTTTPQGTSGSEYFIIWRETSPGTDVYHTVTPLISRRVEKLLLPINKNSALYSVRVSNFSVFARDFIGFVAFVPSTLRFLDLYNPGSIYKYSSFTDDIDLRNVTSYNRRVSPLITAVIAPSSVACSSTRFLPTPTRSITPSITLTAYPSPVTSPAATFAVASTPTPNSIDPTAVFTSSVPTVSGSSHTVLIVTAAIVSSGITFCLTLLLFTVAILCVAYALKRRNNRRKHCKLGQSSSTECALSDISPEVVRNTDKMYEKISTMENGSSEGDNCSMESNPTYGYQYTDGPIEQVIGTQDKDKYHTLEFECKPAARGREQQHVVNGDSNDYHTLQHLDRKSNYDAESEYCSLAAVSNYINGAGMQGLDVRSGCCDVAALELALVKSEADVAEVENDYAIPHAGHNHVEHCGVIILKPNISYDSLNTTSH